MENKTVTQQQNEELLKAILELPEAEQENVKAYMAGMQAARRCAEAAARRKEESEKEAG